MDRIKKMMKVICAALAPAAVILPAQCHAAVCGSGTGDQRTVTPWLLILIAAGSLISIIVIAAANAKYRK